MFCKKKRLEMKTYKTHTISVSKNVYLEFNNDKMLIDAYMPTYRKAVTYNINILIEHEVMHADWVVTN